MKTKELKVRILIAQGAHIKITGRGRYMKKIMYESNISTVDVSNLSIKYLLGIGWKEVTPAEAALII